MPPFGIGPVDARVRPLDEPARPADWRTQPLVARVVDWLGDIIPCIQCYLVRATEQLHDAHRIVQTLDPNAEYATVHQDMKTAAANLVRLKGYVQRMEELQLMAMATLLMRPISVRLKLAEACAARVGASELRGTVYPFRTEQWVAFAHMLRAFAIPSQATFAKMVGLQDPDAEAPAQRRAVEAYAELQSAAAALRVA